MIWILDTDHVSLFQNNHPAIMRRVNRVNALEIAVTVVTVAEQMRGWLNIINQSPQSGRLIWAYKGLDNGVKYFNQVRFSNLTKTLPIAILNYFNKEYVSVRKIYELRQ